MGLFTIRGRSDSGHHPPYEAPKKRKKLEKKGPKDSEAASVDISHFSNERFKKYRSLKRKMEKGVYLAQLAEEDILEVEEKVNELKYLALNSLEENFDLLKEEISHIGDQGLRRGLIEVFGDFEIDAPGICRFAPNTSLECLGIKNENSLESIEYALGYLQKQKNLISDKKDFLFQGYQDFYGKDYILNDHIGPILDNFNVNTRSFFKIQTDGLTQELLKLI